eukprot:6176525-Pleurochrysis_carterae.AAC.1
MSEGIGGRISAVSSSCDGIPLSAQKSARRWGMSSEAASFFFPCPLQIMRDANLRTIATVCRAVPWFEMFVA